MTAVISFLVVLVSLAACVSATPPCDTGDYLTGSGTGCTTCAANCGQFSALQCPTDGKFTFHGWQPSGTSFDGSTGPGAGCVLCDRCDRCRLSH
jgi:hypothetical protein